MEIRQINWADEGKTIETLSGRIGNRKLFSITRVKRGGFDVATTGSALFHLGYHGWEPDLEKAKAKAKQMLEDEISKYLE